MIALVSILMPAYNAEGWVGAAIGAALLAEPDARKRSFVVDHGSTDGTLAGARQFESNEVRVVTQPNQGAAAARVPSGGDTANPDEWKDDPEKYENLRELPERFFAGRDGTNPQVLQPAQPRIPTVLGCLLSKTDGLVLRKMSWRRKRDFFTGQRIRLTWRRAVRTYFASDLYRNLEVRRSQIRAVAMSRTRG
jgi:hypothetical protein